jgi:hypothetical protein
MKTLSLSVIRSQAPVHYSRRQTYALIGKDSFQKFLTLSRSTQVPVGQEHSKYVTRSLRHLANSRALNAQETVAILENQGRFQGALNKAEFFELRSPQIFACAKLIWTGRTSLLPKLPVKDIRLFMGRAGQSSSLHFDWNAGNNLLVNLEGDKSFDLYPPDASWDFRGYSNFSKKKGGHLATRFRLGPGESILIPNFWWHQSHYHTPSSSISIRFHPEHHLKRLTQVLYPSWKFLALAAEGQLGPRAVNAILAIARRSTSRTHSDSVRRVEAYLNRCLRLKPTQDHPYYKPCCGAHLLHFHSKVKD